MKNHKIILLIGILNFGLLIGKKKSSKRTHSEYAPILNEIVIQIFRDCHRDYDSLIISDNDDEKIDSTVLQNLHSTTSVILYQHLAKYERKIAHTKKIDAFILFISSVKHLKDKLKKFKKTSWSKPMPLFYVLHKSNNSCIMNEQILMTLWSFKIIAYFICTGAEQNSTYIFTFNPYNRWAPDHWKWRASKERIKENDDKFWSLFVRKYEKENICNQLDFDRTRVLRKYTVTIASRNSGEDKNPVIEGNLFPPEKFKHVRKHLDIVTIRYIDIIKTTLGLKVRLHVVPNWMNHGVKKKVLQPIFNNMSVDLFTFTSSSDVASTPIYEYSFPAYCHRMGILTHYRGYKTPIEKIRDFYGKWILLFTIFILVVVFVVIWLSEGRRFYFAAFEIIRLLITAGLFTKMNTLSLRLFFTAILLYFLIIQATFNGNLAEFLTKPELRKHAESLKDLEGPLYSRIYGAVSAQFLMTNLIDNGKPFIRLTNCWKAIFNDTSAACVTNYVVLHQTAFMNKSLYLSKIPFGFQYNFYLIRVNWPLSDRINHVIMRIWESGIREYWEWKPIQKYILNETMIEERSDERFSPISMEQLTFAFIMLGIGLMFAIISFIVEMCIFKKRNRIIKLQKKQYRCCCKNFMKSQFKKKVFGPYR